MKRTIALDNVAFFWRGLLILTGWLTSGLAKNLGFGCGKKEKSS